MKLLKWLGGLLGLGAKAEAQERTPRPPGPPGVVGWVPKVHRTTRHPGSKRGFWNRHRMMEQLARRDWLAGVLVEDRTRGKPAWWRHMYERARRQVQRPSVMRKHWRRKVVNA